MSKQRGFSLVEVLLALALIGVISVVSIRILSNRDNMLEFTAKRDKVLANMQGIAKERMFNLNVDEIDYNELSNALNTFKTNNGGTRDKASFEISEGTGNYIATVKIDVNGSDIFPNETGRDIYTYYVDRYGNFVLDSISEGNMIVAGGTSLWEPQEPTPITKSDITGDEGSVPDDLDLPEDEDIWKTCWDGSKVKDLSLCPEQNTQKNCGNGVFVPMDEDCPAPIVCWDGSVVTDESLCPEKPDDKTCDNGTVVKADEDCPVKCWDGSWVKISIGCPTQTKKCNDGTIVKADEDCPKYKTCPDGTIVAEGENCPCVAQMCYSGYAFDPVTCSCVPAGNEIPGDDPWLEPITFDYGLSYDKDDGLHVDIYPNDQKSYDKWYSKYGTNLSDWCAANGNPEITVVARIKNASKNLSMDLTGQMLDSWYDLKHISNEYIEKWGYNPPYNIDIFEGRIDISIEVYANGKLLPNARTTISSHSYTNGGAFSKEAGESDEQYEARVALHSFYSRYYRLDAPCSWSEYSNGRCKAE